QRDGRAGDRERRARADAARSRPRAPARAGAAAGSRPSACLSGGKAARCRARAQCGRKADVQRDGGRSRGGAPALPRLHERRRGVAEAEQRARQPGRRTPREARAPLTSVEDVDGATISVVRSADEDPVALRGDGEPKSFRGSGLRWKGRARIFLERRTRFFTTRSEEHTSELQSRENLVCRLLLEKKQNRTA